ncbi:MAG: prepilin-type N-terminal cleavage/methylation domain-containing protein [Candidatus Hydrogenedentes bacterium]|nr:prepilin-type N-terminal cleavage/methylation domain-containing protein [Candidatus Hydrogenedentota bacterium]
MNRTRGFTLIEILIATGMLSVLAAAGFAALSAGIRSSAKSRRYGAMIAHGQMALEMMTRDIRSAVQSGKFCMASLDNQYEGLDADTLDFVALGAPRMVHEEAGGNRCEVGYYIENDPDTEFQWLLRREDNTLDNDALEGGTVMLAGPYVSELNLEFYDGQLWQSGWDNHKTFPVAVRIYITVVDKDGIENPIHFTTTVPILVR